MSKAERETPTDLAGELNAGADLVRDIAEGKISVREEAESLLGDMLDGIFGKRQSAEPAKASASPTLTVHAGGKCT